MTPPELEERVLRFAGELDLADPGGILDLATERGYARIEDWAAGQGRRPAPEVTAHTEPRAYLLTFSDGGRPRRVVTRWVNEGGAWRLDDIEELAD